MLRLKRPPPPKIFASAELAREKARAREFFELRALVRGQKRFDWMRTIRLVRRADSALMQMTTRKCAYCESTVGTGTGYNLEMFRPKAHAIGREGDVAADGYWWLAFEWENLFPSCQACNVAKASRFPIAGTRARPEATGEALAAEQPLLLDPTIDDPVAHLFFDEQGLVSSPTERGRVTIEVLALNREPLVKQREDQIRYLRDAFDVLRSIKTQSQQALADWRGLLSDRLDARQPYLAAKRQLLGLWIGELPKKAGSAGAIKILQKLIMDAPAGGAVVSRSDIQQSQDSFRSHQEEKERHSVEAGSRTAKAAYFGGVRRLERIVVENFKGIRKLELSIPLPSAERESWLMLVGENATGKSSVLQAIALGLLGQTHIDKMGLNAREFVTEGELSGKTSLHLTNVSSPVVLSYTSKDRGFAVQPPAELVLLLGYGATRLLPRSPTTKKIPSRYVRVKNLFNPYARLQDAEAWLTNRRVVKAPLFEQIAVALKQLLLLDDSARIIRERSRVFVRSTEHKTSLRALSDGYQSIVALAVDIMMGLAVRWKSMDVAEGVVLIDEIETHLHPRWKMEIVARLRRVFPKLTFIATTHDPLCLRGLEPGEIVVLRRQNQQVTATVITESIANLRADQLLTSELFGLYGTRDPAVTAAVLRHAALSSQTRSADEELELRDLTKQLAGNLPTGETQTDRAAERSWHKIVGQELLPKVRRKLADKSHVANLPVDAKRALESLIGTAVVEKEL